MPVLTTQQRKNMSSTQFALPKKKGSAGRGSYPIPDKAHARVAKAYASKEANAGKLSPSDKARIDAKANKMLGKKSNAKKIKKAASNMKAGNK